ncbi:MAG: hypothetical protein IJW45_06885, partial [Oscillospiraceae bacterium]|nr:hypothetical protein [Oscillospiraceae bacterium]
MEKKRWSRVLLAVLLCITMIMPYVAVLVEVAAAPLENFETDGDFEGLKFSLIGDSISSFYGVSNSSTYNPLYLTTSEATFGTYYGNTGHGSYSQFSDVTRDETWWQQTVDTLGMDLLVNISWSGSHIMDDTAQGNTTEYGAAAYKDRCVNLHMGSTKPDIIAVYMGTNDVAHCDSTNGGSKANIDTASERSALYTSVNNFATPATSVEAYYIMISRMLATYPDAEVYCMLPTIWLSTMSSARLTAMDNFNNGIRYLVEYYQGQGKKIYLVDLDKDSGLVDNETVKNYYYCNNVHPGCEGMDWITACLVSEILEHSQKGKQTSTYHEVSYDLTESFVTMGLPRQAVAGKPFQIDLEPYETYQDIRLSVTMTDPVTGEAVQIPGGGVSGESVYIPEVTGPVSITATAYKEDDYYWHAQSNAFVSGYGPGISFNDVTLQTGTYSAGAMDAVQYLMTEPVLLQHDKPWELEFRGGGGTFAGGILLFSDTVDSSTSGNTYIHMNQSSVFFGYRDSVGYNNSGISWASIAEGLGSSVGSEIRTEVHTYRFVNEPTSSSNMIRLYVDGVDMGTMDQSKMIGASATHESVSAIDISGKDFFFNYMGTTSHPLQNCSIEYIKVFENGEQPVEEPQDYRWEINGAGDAFVSLEDDTFQENALTMLSGSVSGGTFTGVQYQLHEQVVLMHDETWSITWESEGDWVDNGNGAMLFATAVGHKGMNAPYLYRRHASEFIAFGEWDGSYHCNYGIRLADYGIDGTVKHKYELCNEIADDGSNMVYLYVDDVKIGALDNYFQGGATTSSEKSDWISGKDFAFSYIGTNVFTVGGCDMTYLQVKVECEHVFGDWSVVDATCTADGYQTRSCTLCDLEEKEILSATGHSYEEAAVGSSCVDFAHTSYVCSSCGDSYKEYDETIMSAWQETKPDVDESFIQTKQQYRYRDYTMVESYEASMTGADLLSSTWVQSGTKTVEYVSSWPSGFSTSHSLYSTYNKASSKVTASETTTTKTVIDSDAVVGYLWYHWCYSNSYYSVNASSGSYTTFHAYYGTTAPSNYTSDTDGSYCTSHSTCSNSEWWWPVTVYAQKSTSYDKLFTYGMWGEWSDWSDTAVASSDTRQVEERTLYRYADGEYGEHDFVDGSCTLCGQACAHDDHDVNGLCTVCGGAVAHSYEGVVTAPTCTAGGYTTYTCTVCGDTYVGDETDVVGHSYEAVVTAPTCTAGGYTTYTCTVCGDTYVGDETDVVGHSYEAVVTAPICTAGGYTTYTCTVCGDTYVGDETDVVGHSYETVVTAPSCIAGGYTTYTCNACGDSYVGDETDVTGHTFVGGFCSVCFARDPDYDPEFYLFGYIDGANYACEEDAENLGSYHFDGSTLVVRFQQDSYVGVKTGDNQNWYMTRTYVTGNSATLYHTSTGANEKMFVPGGVEVTFLLLRNSDGTLDLSYEVTQETVVQPTLALSYGTVSFESEILYNIYFNASDLDDVVEMGMITFDSQLTDGTIDDAVAVYSNYSTDGTLYMVATEGIAAKRMADQMWFKIYAKLSDGSYVYTSVNYYSAVRYANSILGRTSSSSYSKALVVAMLNYGAEAQLYFGYN